MLSFITKFIAFIGKNDIMLDRALNKIIFANSCNKFSTKWQLIRDSKLASRLIQGKNSVNSTIGRNILSELTEDPTYVNPTYPRFVVLKSINIIGTAAFCPSWAKIRLTRVRLIYIYIFKYTTNCTCFCRA